MGDGEVEFNKLHDTFWPKRLRYLTNVVGRRDAEDLTQEVFVKINQALKTFRGESQLSKQALTSSGPIHRFKHQPGVKSLA